MDEASEEWPWVIPPELTEAEQAEYGAPPEQVAYEAVDWEYLPEADRRRKRRFVADALTASQTGCQEFVNCLADLALDLLVKDARRRAYYIQLKAVGDAPRERLEMDKDRAASESSDIARLFRQDLRIVVQQEVRTARQKQREAEQAGAPPRATPSIFREVVRSAETHLRERWGTTHEPDVDELVERCASNVAAMLTFTNAHRARAGSNHTWWSVLAHRTVSRCLLPKLGMGQELQEFVQAVGRRPSPDALQRRAGLFVAVILEAIVESPKPFEYRGVGPAIDYAKFKCLEFERKEREERAKRAAEKKLREKLAREEAEEQERMEARPTTLRVTQGIVSETVITPQDGPARRAEKLAGQAYYQQHLWEIVERTLGPRDALRFWPLALLHRDDFTWKEVVELFHVNDPASRYEGSLPPGVVWDDVALAFGPMKMTDANLRRFWSTTSTVVATELIKCNAAIPW